MSTEPWRPDHTTNTAERPTVGDTVAHARAAWIVTHVADAEPTPEENDRLAVYTPAGRTARSPYRVTLHRVHGPRHPRENVVGDIAVRVGIHRYSVLPRYPRGRVPLCACCAHPWPCLEADQERQAKREMEDAERELAVLPGCCPECGEPVTSRQRGITFDGPNVRNPLADSPTFHLRRQCRSGAEGYEDAWVAADPTRKRSLLTLRCDGTVLTHWDGSGECDQVDCPSVYARHRHAAACYTQRGGCPRGCQPSGHPGTAIAGYPDDPREPQRAALDLARHITQGDQ